MPPSTDRKQYQYFTPLALLYLTITVTSTSVAYKPVDFFGVTVTASSLLFALTFAITSIIAEVYGRIKTKKLVNQVIFFGLLFSMLVTIIPKLPSPSTWHHQSDFSYVFGNSFRFALLGTIGSLLSYKINIFLITKWKKLTQGKLFPLRIIGANTCGEFFLVAIVTFGSFYELYSFNELMGMFIFAYLSKIFYAIILSWPSAFIAILLRKKEKIDVYD